VRELRREAPVNTADVSARELSALTEAMNALQESQTAEVSP